METLEIGKKYTMISVGGMGATCKGHIKITQYVDDKPVFKSKGKGNCMKRKEYYLKMDNETLLFEGWEIPFKTNTEFSSFTMNAKINLVGERVVIRDWVENKNLNDKFDARHRILIYPEPYHIDKAEAYGVQAEAEAKAEPKAGVDVIGWPV